MNAIIISNAFFNSLRARSTSVEHSFNLQRVKLARFVRKRAKRVAQTVTVALSG
jgi:hypothetical protein